MAPSSSKARKEEAELRSIAKRSRLARKQVKTRERRETVRATRLAQTVGAPAASVEAPRCSDGKRRGALILPGEIAEMRRRHGGSGAVLTGTEVHPHTSPALADSSSATRAGASKRGGSPATATAAKKSRARDNKEAKKATAGNRSAPSLTQAPSALTGTTEPAATATMPNNVQEPSYHFEIHFKKKEVMVDVNLHHIPPHKINVSETTPHVLVVDTTAHTKRYRLVLPMPAGLRIDVEQSSFEFAHGVLQCRMPVASGEIPTTLQSEWEAMHARMQAQKKLRFRVRQDGALTVRSRRAVLTPSSSQRGAGAAATETDDSVTSASKENNNDDDAAANVVVPVATNSVAKKKEKKVGEAEAKQTSHQDPSPAQTRQTNKTKATAADAAVAATRNDKPTVSTSSSSLATPAAPAMKGRTLPRAGGDRVDVHTAEHARALELAQQAGNRVRATLASRVQMAEEVQRRREARMQVRSTRKEQRDSKQQSAFARVLEEQKKSLLGRVAQQNEAAVAVQQRRAVRESRGAAPKSVRFAE